jgi:GTP pyrophosphokinase
MLKQAEMLFARIKEAGVYDYEKILKAYQYAESLHEGQKRISGEDYIVHPLSVAEEVFKLQLDTDAICAAFLHDTVEDCSDKINLTFLRKEFGNDVAEIVDGTSGILAQAKTYSDGKLATARTEITAEIDADVKVVADELAGVKATAEAEANKHLASSITQQLIDYKYYETWDGKLPSVMGTDTIIKMP